MQDATQNKITEITEKIRADYRAKMGRDMPEEELKQLNIDVSRQVYEMQQNQLYQNPYQNHYQSPYQAQYLEQPYKKDSQLSLEKTKSEIIFFISK